MNINNFMKNGEAKMRKNHNDEKTEITNEELDAVYRESENEIQFSFWRENDIKRQAIALAIEDLIKEEKPFRIVGYDFNDGLIVVSKCYDGRIDNVNLFLFLGICERLKTGTVSDVELDYEPDYVKEIENNIKDVDEFRRVLEEYIDTWQSFDFEVAMHEMELNE